MARITQIVNSFVPIKHVDSWLDFGTGDGAVVKDMKFNDAKLKVAIEKQDIDIPGWQRADTILDALEIGEYNYDLLTMFDSIEHLEKQKGINLLQYAMGYAKHIIVFTPDGFLPQDENTHPELIASNPYQLHKCGWTVEEFEDLGFSTHILKNFHNTPTGIYNAILAWR